MIMKCLSKAPLSADNFISIFKIIQAIASRKNVKTIADMRTPPLEKVQISQRMKPNDSEVKFL